MVKTTLIVLAADGQSVEQESHLSLMKRRSPAKSPVRCHPTLVFECLNRYETALWRQAVQNIRTLKPIRVR